jgi:pantoate--beta-alanine ligase
VKLLRTAEDMRGEMELLRKAGRRIAFVPTMGALHAGHTSLLERASAGGQAAVLSVFVNPLQFGPGEDLARYPRDLDRDTSLARESRAEILFAPGVDELLHPGFQITVDPGPLGDELEGRVRPGHFRGVLTIVAKLLNIVRPDLAVFGQKDLQQAVLVRQMVRDLNFGVEIEVAPTVRESDGVALSSRNAYLTVEERRGAGVLFGGLATGERAARAGERAPERVRAEIERVLGEAPGVVPDYVAVRRADDLSEVREVRGSVALLAAMRIGSTRLIDNLIVDV